MERSLHRHSLRDAHIGLQRLAGELRSRASALPSKIRVDISKVPDWQRRATRLSIAIVLFGLLGHCVTLDPEDAPLVSNFRQSCNWAAITCIVVTAPVIGKVAQVAFDRLVGTAVGGLIGFACYTAGFHLFGGVGGGVFVSLMAGLTVWGTTFLAFRCSLDQLARFMMLTYCIVAFGAKPDKGASLLALLRVGGIFAGGLLSVLLAVVVLPRSASVESLREMRKAVKALHDLNKEVWAVSGVIGGQSQLLMRRPSRRRHRHGYSALQELEQKQHEGQQHQQQQQHGTNSAAAAKAAAPEAHPSASNPAMGGAGGDGQKSALSGRGSGGSGGGGGVGLGHHTLSADQLDLLVQHDEELDSREAAIEKLFTAVYSTLDKVDEALGQTKGEIYVWHFWGRYFFLPGVHWFPVRGRWRVPKQDMQDLATCLRRVARMLWTLLLDFEEGFGSEMQAVLRAYYPAQLLSELADYQGRAILDLLQAFPGGKAIEVDNLFTLGQVTDCLLQISDARARNAVFNMKRRRPTTTGSTLPRPSVALVAAAGSLQQNRDYAAMETGSAPADGGAGGAAAAAALEKAPLLPLPAYTMSSAPSGASSRARSSGSATAAAPAAATVADGGGGGGVFISRLLSGQPGGQVALPLPPRRFLQGQAAQAASQAQAQGQLDLGQVAQAKPPGAGAAVPTVSPAAAAALAAAGGAGPRGQAPGPGQGYAPGVAAAPAPARPPGVGTPARPSLEGSVGSGSLDIDILGGLRFDASEGPAAGSAAVSGTASPSLPRLRLSAAAAPPPADTSLSLQPHPLQQQLQPQQHHSQDAYAQAQARPPQSGQSHSAQRPKPPPALPTIPSSQDMATGADNGASLRGASDCGSASCSGSSAAAPVSPFDGYITGAAGATEAKEESGGKVIAGDGRPAGPSATEATGAAAAAAPAAGSRGSSAFANPHNSPPLSSGVGVSAAGAGIFAAGEAGLAGMGGASLRGGGGLVGVGELSLAGSSLLVEPITFPPTEEGYFSQVRWYSFQFVMDELVNELEEAFCAASAVLRQLPYPVGGTTS